MQWKKMWTVFWTVLCICLPIRLFQQIFLVDRSTGFYTDGGVTSWIISLILVAGILAVFWLYFQGRPHEKLQEATPMIRNMPAAASAMVYGLLFIGVGVYSYTGIPVIKNEAINIVFAATSLLAGCAVLVSAYDLASGENHLAKFPFLGLLAPFWGCVCLVGMFITYTALVNEAENFYDTGTMIFLLLFLFAHSKYMVGMDSRRKLFLYGFPAAMLSAVTGIPVVVLGIFGMEQGSAFPVSLHLLNLSGGIYTWQILRALEAKGIEKVPSAKEKKQIVPAVVSAPSLEKAFPKEPVFEEKNAAYGWNTEDERRCREFLMKQGGKELFIVQKKSPYEEKF